MPLLPSSATVETRPSLSDPKPTVNWDSNGQRTSPIQGMVYLMVFSVFGLVLLFPELPQTGRGAILSLAKIG